MSLLTMMGPVFCGKETEGRQYRSAGKKFRFEGREWLLPFYLYSCLWKNFYFFSIGEKTRIITRLSCFSVRDQLLRKTHTYKTMIQIME